ncbi:uncharacterized protein YigE (DUF2233 family) [Albidovulum inexpectatum]|uniref:Uncharacterized protein YigE (DUF2233 family) n=1 Tax=Albidovulum inexpectatum TaxID=196587 RepID=A0A2S5JM54_9RHOB|nr:phosphodiester glycosidase family protein [Albidovulum inexpectatum]PPB82569.1 uncharacterized protein YigE (DUF2233 family) [Albidovulum inexpectatum]
MIRIAARLALLWVCLAVPAWAQTCRQTSHDGQSYAVCEVHAGDDLRLFLTDEAGATIGTFDRLRAMVAGQGKRVVMAMNAGMYHPDRRPVGLYLENGQIGGRLVTRPGPGNFGMQPNGVFCIARDGFAVIETLAYDRVRPECRYASQSGPMLVIDGRLHPRFLPDSSSRFIRNGVGVSADGQTAWLAISDRPVTFHEFARLFRDALGARDALYFDGRISRLYAPELGRDDFGFPMGPIVALIAPADDGQTTGNR